MLLLLFAVVAVVSVAIVLGVTSTLLGRASGGDEPARSALDGDLYAVAGTVVEVADQPVTNRRSADGVRRVRMVVDRGDRLSRVTVLWTVPASESSRLAPRTGQCIQAAGYESGMLGKMRVYEAVNWESLGSSAPGFPCSTEYERR